MDEAGGSVMHDLSGSGLDGSDRLGRRRRRRDLPVPRLVRNVDPYGRLAGTVPPDAGAVEIVDRSDILDRGLGSFVVTLHLRSDLTPLRDVMPAAPGT